MVVAVRGRARRSRSPRRSATAAVAVLKARVTEAVNTYFAPLRERRASSRTTRRTSTRCCAQGNERANEVAETTLDEVRTRMGMIYA